MSKVNDITVVIMAFIVIFAVVSSILGVISVGESIAIILLACVMIELQYMQISR